MYTHDIPRSFTSLSRSECLDECLRLAKENQHAPDTLLSAVHLADRYSAIENTESQGYSQELAHIVTVLAAKAHEDKGYSSIIYVWSKFQNPLILEVWVRLLQLTELYVPRFLVIDTILRAVSALPVEGADDNVLSRKSTNMATLTNIGSAVIDMNHHSINEDNSVLSRSNECVTVDMNDDSITEDNMSEDISVSQANTEDILTEVNSYIENNAWEDLIWNVAYTIADKNTLLRYDSDHQRLLSLAATFLLSRSKLQYSSAAAKVLFQGMIESIRVRSDLETEDILDILIRNKSRA